jgi:hypothetical protein
MQPPNIGSSRAPPKKVEPLTIDNIEYTAPWGKIGFIEARDVETGKLLWDLKVYNLEIDPQIEQDVQEIYITSIIWNQGQLEVTTEVGTTYVVNPIIKEVSLKE